MGVQGSCLLSKISSRQKHKFVPLLSNSLNRMLPNQVDLYAPASSKRIDPIGMLKQVKPEELV